MHVRQPDGSIAWTATTGGVAVALDALFRERGGPWIAHGTGDADRLVLEGPQCLGPKPRGVRGAEAAGLQPFPSGAAKASGGDVGR